MESQQQQIHFCASADGTRLAVATVGDGPPLMKAATWLTHVEKEPYNLVTRHWIAEVSRDNMLIRYDSRGTGLSDRDVERITMEAWIEDLEAVVTDFEIERFPLLGLSQGAAIAVNYAARHPDKVSHLILYGACAARTSKTQSTGQNCRRCASDAQYGRTWLGCGQFLFSPCVHRSACA